MNCKRHEFLVVVVVEWHLG